MLLQWILPFKGFPLRGRLENAFRFLALWFLDSLKLPRCKMHRGSQSFCDYSGIWISLILKSSPESTSFSKLPQLGQ